MALIGIAPLTMVRTNAGRSEYVYAGAPAPADILAEDRERLVDEGFLVEVEDAAVPDEVVVPDDPATGSAGPGVTLERPKKVANKQAWLDYRVAQGLLRPELAADVTAANLQDDAFMASFLERADAEAAQRAAEEQAARAAEEAALQAADSAQTDSTS